MKSLANDNFDISPTPDGVIGVQQGLAAGLLVQLKAFNSLKAGDVIQIKLTGDGTNIGRTNFPCIYPSHFSVLTSWESFACNLEGSRRLKVIDGHPERGT